MTSHSQTNRLSLRQKQMPPFHMLSAYFAIRLIKILLICCFLKVSSSDFGCNRVMMNDWMQNSSRDLNKTFLLKNKSANFSFYLRKKSFQLYTNSLLHVPSQTKKMFHGKNTLFSQKLYRNFTKVNFTEISNKTQGFHHFQTRLRASTT